MKTLLRQKQIFFLLLTSASLLTLAACDNSVGSDDHDHDTNPYGVMLTLDGVEIAKQEGGDIIYNNDRNIEVTEGEESDVIQVRWINEHSETFLPDTEEGYSMRWDIGDEDILNVVQHDSYGPWDFHFEGVAAGETTIRLTLWHNDHEHFTSLQFDVDVQPAGSPENSDS